jgi:beta-mannosidase
LDVIVDEDGETVHISCKKPIKGLVMDTDGEEPTWSDQALDVFPGDPQVVRTVGLNGREILVRFLGDNTNYE